MIGFRNGSQQTMCDRCYRPQIAGEAGWTRIKTPRRYPARDDPARVVTVTEDRCPSCSVEVVGS